jgi:hypothetical protein
MMTEALVEPLQELAVLVLLEAVLLAAWEMQVRQPVAKTGLLRLASWLLLAAATVELAQLGHLLW